MCYLFALLDSPFPKVLFLTTFFLAAGRGVEAAAGVGGVTALGAVEVDSSAFLLRVERVELMLCNSIRIVQCNDLFLNEKKKRIGLFKQKKFLGFSVKKKQKTVTRAVIGHPFKCKMML